MNNSIALLQCFGVNQEEGTGSMSQQGSIMIQHVGAPFT